MKAADVAAAHPEAVSFAKLMRDEFGEAKLIYALNKATGATLGAPLLVRLHRQANASGQIAAADMFRALHGRPIEGN